MHFLLVNRHPAVSRLIVLSTQKLGYEIDEVASFEDLPLESYNIVFVDSELYDEIAIDSLRESGFSRNFICIVPRGEKKPENIDYILQKPFLPTDFIDLVSRVQSEDSGKVSDLEVEAFSGKEINLEDEEIDIDLDDIELESIDDLDLEEEDVVDNEADLSRLEEREHGVDSSEMKLDDVELDSELDAEMLKQNEEENGIGERDNIDSEELDSILDSEEIDEVKKLLEDEFELDEDREEQVTLDGYTGEILKEEDKDESIEEFDLDDFKEDEKDEVLELDKESQDDKEEPQDFENDDENIDLKEETNDLDDSLVVTEVEDDLEIVREIESQELDGDIVSSIEDIGEDELIKALGGEVEALEESCEESQEKEEEDEQIDIEKEIEEKVSSSIRSVLSESSIKEVLKGMRVNVSITFEEDI